MRPVNLLPPDLRSGARAPMRTGPVPYVLLGALVAVLVGVALLVTADNQVAEGKSELAQLKREDAAARQEAKRLAGYVQFQTMHEERVRTITELADSRFDWERVMRELSLVLPHSVWLTSLSASASSDTESGGSSNLRSTVAGPALVLKGCATGQDAVAGFVTALKDIDGVTRVGVESSELGSDEEGSGSAGGGSGSGGAAGGGECQTRKWIAAFSLVVAFDAAPIPLTAEGEGEVPANATENAEATSENSSSEAESSEGG
jgi:Tfp pilus assembly protein PilN